MMNEAVVNGDIELVKELISLGINVNQPDKKGCQPLPLAVCRHNFELVQILLGAGATISNDVLYGLAEVSRFNLRILSLLIQAGLDFDPTILEDEETFLMQAAHRGELDAVKLLVDAGADVNRIDREYNFPLANAGHGKHEEVFKYLAPLTSPELRKMAADQLPSRYVRILNSLEDSHVESTGESIKKLENSSIDPQE